MVKFNNKARKPLRRKGSRTKKISKKVYNFTLFVGRLCHNRAKTEAKEERDGGEDEGEREGTREKTGKRR